MAKAIKITSNTKLTNERMSDDEFRAAVEEFVNSKSKAGTSDDPENFDLWMGGGNGSWNMTAGQLAQQWDEQVEEWKDAE